MPVDLTLPNDQDDISVQELDLYHAIMEYRASLGLAAVPLSRALSTTAGRHVVDTRENIWAEDLELPEDANLHSWSDAFYFDDARDPEVMWEAPQRLGTGYDSPGYEISAAGFETVEDALQGWIESTAHNAVLSNTGVWADLEFFAIGVGIDTSPGEGIYAGRIFHVWFGEAADAEAPSIVGGVDADTIQGTDFADVINGGEGDDSIRSGRDEDVVRGGIGDDRLSGDSSDDSLFGGNGNDRMFGGGGDDRLSGGVGDDRLSGSSGDDRLYGDEGDDLLTGGLDRDVLTGGEGADTFAFGAVEDIGLDTPRDIIMDFESGSDLIDLSAIDAAAASRLTDDAFRFIGDREFRGDAGQLRQNGRLVEGDVDGDGAADFTLQLRPTAVLASEGDGDPEEVVDIPVLTADDFVL